MLTKPKFVVGQLVAIDGWGWIGAYKVASVFHNSITARSRYRVETLDGTSGGYFDEEDLTELTVEDSRTIPAGSGYEAFNLDRGTIIRSEDTGGDFVAIAEVGSSQHPGRRRTDYMYMPISAKDRSSWWTSFDLAKRSAEGEVFRVVGGFFSDDT